MVQIKVAVEVVGRGWIREIFRVRSAGNADGLAVRSEGGEGSGLS